MKLAKNWQECLADEIAKPYIKDLKAFLEEERASDIAVYPEESEVFHAFKMTHFDEVKVVIMGQDPYHGPGQAHGMSFSVPRGVRAPPSLKNIYKELSQDVQIPPPETGCLSCWAKQGVLMLNATLTVRACSPKSHYGKGWELFTGAVLAKLIEREKPMVFMLWGKSAQEKCNEVLANTHHAVLTAAHPSPFSAMNGFFGCKHFSKANELLNKWGQSPIDWSIRNIVT